MEVSKQKFLNEINKFRNKMSKDNVSWLYLKSLFEELRQIYHAASFSAMHPETTINDIVIMHELFAQVEDEFNTRLKMQYQKLQKGLGPQ